MGVVDPVPLREANAGPDRAAGHEGREERFLVKYRLDLIVILFAAAVYLTGIISPPSLMDDVDAAQAEMARNMLRTGDWVSNRMDGVLYLEKSPGKYWLIAISFMIFGAHDWAARLPIALVIILLCWVVYRIGRWAFSEKAGFYAGLVLATCTGLFLFTRILIPDVIVTFTITLGLWAFLRALEEDEEHPRLWAWGCAVSLAAGVLLKGLIGVLFPAGAGFLYLLFTKQLFSRRTWSRLHPFSGSLIFLLIAAPWHVLATLSNPPYFDFTMESGPGEFRGFFWFYFINEHVLRFLNKRYPHDYNTVPQLYFWLYQLLWMFPWSVFFPAVAKLKYRVATRAGRTRVLALCWIGFVMGFFTLSTTQEYYSMPIYPAMALLLGCAMASRSEWLPKATRIAAVVASVAAVITAVLVVRVWNLPTPGDISVALNQNPDLYTLSLGHMADLTISSMAYVRVPLALASIACLVGAAGAWWFRGRRAYLALALMMVLFLQAARIALVAFDPYMSSRPLAEALNRAPKGRLILNGPYYTFSSVFFYTEYTALLLNGRRNNLEYGSNAPGAPKVFIDDAQFVPLWLSPERCYLLAEDIGVPRLEKLVGGENLHAIRKSGGKTLFTNRDLALSAGAGAIRRLP